MNRYLFSLPAITDWCFRLLGLDVVIERGPSSLGFWEFSYVRTQRWEHQPAEHQCWGLGLHVIVSRWGPMSSVR